MQPTFEEELRALLNRYSKENGSDTPDFILATYLADCLAALDKLHDCKRTWFTRD